jgi:putative membrane protein
MLLDKRIPITYILGQIKLEIIIIVIIAVVAHYAKAPIKDTLPDMPIGVPSFLGTAISIILSFKLNQSYDRWWEARKIWGSIVNDSRTFVIQLQSFLNSGNESAVRKISFRHIGWCFSLSQSLRGESGNKNMERYLSHDDLESIAKHLNKPLAILQLNAQHIAKLRDENKMDLRGLIQINNTLANFSNAMGMAERIKNTVFPATYRLFLRLFIYIFVVTLSISLADTQGYFQIPLLLIITCPFFLLEKTSSLLQNPFSNKPTDTAMTAIATTIEINIKQLLNEIELPEPSKPHEFYLL